MLVHDRSNDTPHEKLIKVNFSDVSAASIQAAEHSQAEDPAGTHEETLYWLARRSPELAAHVVLRAQEGQPVDALGLVHILLTHAGNAALEHALMPQQERAQ